MEVVIVELLMAGLSVMVQRGRTALHRAPEPWQLVLIVVMDEKSCDHQNIAIIIGLVRRCIDDIVKEKLV
jgi:hypothetical protein